MSASSGYEAALARLEPKEQFFVREYLVDLNRIRAYAASGHKAKNANVAGVSAYRMLRKANIAEAVRLGLEQRAAKVEVTADFVLGEFLKLASVDPAGAFAEDGSLLPIHKMPADVRKAIAGLDVVEMEGAAEIGGSEGIKHKPMYTKKLKFWDKNRSLENLGRHLSLFKDQLHLTGNLRFAQVTDAELERKIAELRA